MFILVLFFSLTRYRGVLEQVKSLDRLANTQAAKVKKSCLVLGLFFSTSLLCMMSLLLCLAIFFRI